MLVKDYKEKVVQNIEKYSKCPVVSVRQRMDGYYNVLVQDDKVLYDIIKHFIVYQI